MEWTEAAIGQLQSLWAEGHSTAEIGRRMGITKNAVVGKAHRLELSARPSPIRRGEADARPATRRVSGPTLPPLAGAIALPPRPAPRPRLAEDTAPPPPAPAVPRPAPVPVSARPVVVPRAAARLTACCWPIGEPGTRSFRFCDAESVPGKPYCAEHAAVAYVRVRDRREEAA